MNHGKPDTRDFSVIQFSLAVGDDGRPLQRAVPCGSFASVEEAFDLARKLAGEEVGRLEAIKSGETATGGPRRVQPARRSLRPWRAKGLDLRSTGNRQW